MSDANVLSVAEQGYAATKDNAGVPLFVSPYADLRAKPGLLMDSWYIISHVESERGPLDLLVHYMKLNMPPGVTVGNMPDGAVVQSALSVYDSATTTASRRDGLTSEDKASFATDSFDVEVPEGRMTGDSSGMHVTGSYDNIAFDLRLDGDGIVLANLGTGLLPFWGDVNYEYGLVDITTTGTVTIDGAAYDVSGTSWFDRQWGDVGRDFWDPGRRWTWFGISLDDGVRISLWEMHNSGAPSVHTFATVRHPDGRHEIVTVDPLGDGASEHWTSPSSGHRYPTVHDVTIPQLDATLHVRSHLPDQEVGRKYAGASSVTGTMRGRQVSGRAVLELSGNWKV